MFEDMTYEKIIKRALARVQGDIDKRQGSIIYDAIAPACAELAQMYISLDHVLAITFTDTSYGEWLEKRCAETGVHREGATAAIRLGLFYDAERVPRDVPIGSIYSIETLNYAVIEKISTGRFMLVCEETGISGNQLFGKLIPVDTIPGLSYAELSEVLIPGEDVETDASLYERYVEAVNSTPYGGNIDDYKQKVKAISGVGGCKVFPVWNGGGTVKVAIITSEYMPPSEALITEVQEIICPAPFDGKGIAPIGHDVTVAGVNGISVNFATTLIYKSGTTTGQVSEDVKAVLTDYLAELSAAWENEEYLVVRINQMEARILSVEGILDISGTTLNGGMANISLDAGQIPVMGAVVLK